MITFYTTSVDTEMQGRIQDFKLGGGRTLKNVGVFRVKNHDFTTKKSYSFQF